MPNKGHVDKFIYGGLQFQIWKSSIQQDISSKGHDMNLSVLGKSHSESSCS